MSTKVRFKCVSAHKVLEGQNTFYDGRLLAAAASEQPDGLFIVKPAGKLDLQRLAAQPFEVDKEYVITIDEAPASTGADAAAGAQASPSAAESTAQPADKPAAQAQPTAAEKPAAQPAAK